MVAEVRGFVNPLPESVPPLAQGPPAVQLLALVELQVNVERPLLATGLGEAVIEAVGTVPQACVLRPGVAPSPAQVGAPPPVASVQVRV